MHKHFGDNIIASILQSYAALGDAYKLVSTDKFWDISEQTVTHLRDVKGEPTDLLFDESLETM